MLILKKNTMRANDWFERNYNYILYGFGSFLLLTTLWYALFRRFNIDEFQTIQSAFKTIMGETIYIDFFEHHHPLSHYFLIPILKLFGPTLCALRTMRFIMFLFMCGIGHAVYLISKQIYDRTTGIIAPILLLATPIFTIHAIEIIPDVPSICASMYAFLFFIRYVTDKKILFLLLSALSLSLSFLILQKAIFFIFLLGLLFLFYLIKKDLTITDTFIYAITFMLPVVIFLLLLYKNNALAAYFKYNWQYNMQLGNGKIAFSQLFETFNFAFHTNQPFWLFYLLGILFATKNSSTKNNRLVFYRFISKSHYISISISSISSPGTPLYLNTFSTCDQNNIERQAISHCNTYYTFDFPCFWPHDSSNTHLP